MNAIHVVLVDQVFYSIQLFTKLSQRLKQSFRVYPDDFRPKRQ